MEKIYEATNGLFSNFLYGMGEVAGPYWLKIIINDVWGKYIKLANGAHIQHKAVYYPGHVQWHPLWSTFRTEQYGNMKAGNYFSAYVIFF